MQAVENPKVYSKGCGIAVEITYGCHTVAIV